MARTGTALLPLHGGKVPRWLSVRMARLGRLVAEAIVHHYGRDELLRRLAHPFWFQSFGAVMGMDWHSSGVTTTVVSALKEGLAPLSDELGIYVCGGRGKASRATPAELTAVGERTGLDARALVRASKLVAKVDSAAVQDGYELYLHGFIVAADGKWTVVQQGMNGGERQARRYHWLSDDLRSFVEAPHAAIDGLPEREPIVNLTDERAARARAAQVELAHMGPDPVLRELEKLTTTRTPTLVLPGHHDVRREDVSMRRLGGALLAAKERGPIDFEDLLMTPGVGARTVFALAQVAEVVHGAPSRFADPARFSLAHGGKDGHPYPVPLAVYDETVRVLRSAIDGAKTLANEERLDALRRLDAEARAMERRVLDVDFEGLVADERSRSRAEYGGRTVFDDRAERRRPRARPGPRRPTAAPDEQLRLPLKNR